MLNLIFVISVPAITSYLLLDIIKVSFIINTVISAFIIIAAFIIGNKISQERLYNSLKKVSIVLIFIIAITMFFNVGLDLLSQREINISLNVIIAIGIITTLLFSYYLLLQMNSGHSKTTLSLNNPGILLCFVVAFVMTVLQMLLITNLQIAILEEKILLRGIIPPISLLLFNWGLTLIFGRYLLLLKIKQTEYPNKAQSKAFFVFPHYLNYALPILGFIGTVLGISLSSTGIANVISSPDGISSNSASLGDAIAPLGIAFDTTLVALSLSLIFSLFLVLLESFEEKKLNQ
jgi:hypothetical protein